MRKALTVSLLGLVSLAWSGCDAKKQTEYVAGISTQMQVPKDIASVVVLVSSGGVNVFCNAYQVYNQRVLLPRSLGEFPASGDATGNPITVSVIGLTDVTSDTSSNPFVTDCSFTSQTVGDQTTTAKVLRRSRQPYIQDKILFLPMPLRYSCLDQDCPDPDQTCKGGRCVSMDTDPTFLPAYQDGILDGTGGNCFTASQCFLAAVPPVTVDADNCIYALPNTASAPPPVAGAPANPVMSSGDGINVEVSYDGGFTTEILDLDPVEGFSVPDPTKPQRFQLAPGLCDQVKGYDPSFNPTKHRITEVRATGLCQAKGIYQPLCADDQNNAMGTPGGISPNPDVTACAPTLLTPARSELIILADDTDNDRIFYVGGAGDFATKPLITDALKSAAFKNTNVSLTYYPGGSAINSCGPHPQAVAPELASIPKTGGGAQVDIANSFNNYQDHPDQLKPAGTDPKLSGAMNDAYTQLRGVTNANRRALLIIGNRGFDDASCTDSTMNLAKTAFNNDKIITYVGVLARDAEINPAPMPPPVLPGLSELAAAGDSPAKNPQPYDIRGRTQADQQNVAASAISKIVNDLGTCAYDFPSTSLPADSAVLTYSDPLGTGGVTFHSITHAAPGDCADNDGTGNGWNIVTKNGTKRIIVCGQSCKDYQTTLNTAATYTLIYGQQGPDIPLFAYTPQCAPTLPPASGDH